MSFRCHKIWQSPGFWGRQIICHEESDYHTWTASLHACRPVNLCYLVLLHLHLCWGKKKSFDDDIWSFVVRDTGPSSQRDRLLQVASRWSPVGLLQSLTTSRPWSGVRLCCCLHQRLWEQWVIGVLSADWRRSVSALTVRPPAPRPLWLSLSPPPQLCLVARFPSGTWEVTSAFWTKLQMCFCVFAVGALLL